MRLRGSGQFNLDGHFVPARMGHAPRAGSPPAAAQGLPIEV